MRDKDFLLKIYLENHKPRVDGNTLACTSMHQHTYHCCDAICQIVTEAIEKENMRDQRKLKIATLAISLYASRMMHLKIKAIDTTNL